MHGYLALEKQGKEGINYWGVLTVTPPLPNTQYKAFLGVILDLRKLKVSKRS